MVKKIGVVVNRVQGVRNVVALAERAEELGYDVAWLTSGAEDCMAVMVALTSCTERIELGSAVVQTYPRHPTILAAEAIVLEQLAPGRIRLGIGPSHRPLMEALGIPFQKPLRHLREYLQVLRTLLHDGEVHFRGIDYQVEFRISAPAQVPVLIGALQRGTFELAGELSDGAITWLCPPRYIDDVALPIMETAAAAVGRPTPPLCAHLAVCLHNRGEEVRDAVRETIPNIRLSSYQKMLSAAGYPEALDGVWTDHLVDAVVAWGDETQLSSRLTTMLSTGSSEILIRPIGAGSDPASTIERTVTFVADWCNTAREVSTESTDPSSQSA